MAAPTKQGSMFGGNNMPPFVRGSDTSAAAARSVAIDVQSMKEKIAAHIKNKNKFGATCDEVERALKMPHQTASARIRGLFTDGRLKDSGQRRMTRSKRKATVWVCVAGPGIEPGTSGT